VNYFQNILDYNFTANVEKQFDEIAEGNLKWTDMLDKFYHPFHTKVEETIAKSERNVGERNLGVDPQSGKPVLVKIGRFGPMAQIGEATDEEKPKFASLLKGQRIETITLEEALELFKLPRKVGAYEDKDITAGIGRFGPYIVHNSKFISLKAGVDDPFTVTEDRAIELILKKREDDKNKTIKTFAEDKDILVLNGRFGPYISYKKENYKIPKTKDAASLSYDECLELIKNTETKPKKKKR
ncbi:MAG TPA: topoisomerase C-terminal repeat-containing protein, partial [Bacteroidales bacterium]|nr:topoisomerase C-terminal repeat-containing protein [Bacteroidales bacterium]